MLEKRIIRLMGSAMYLHTMYMYIYYIKTELSLTHKHLYIDLRTRTWNTFLNVSRRLSHGISRRRPKSPEYYLTIYLLPRIRLLHVLYLPIFPFS